MSKFSKQRSINTDFAKFQRQPSASKIQHNIDKIILASKLATSAVSVSTANLPDIDLNVENVYNCEVDIKEQQNEIEGMKELDTIEKFVKEEIQEEETTKRVFHFADVVRKIRNQGFLERIKRLKEMRDTTPSSPN
jgi:hypothetical protein